MSEETSAEKPQRNSGTSGIKILNDEKISPVPVKIFAAVPSKESKETTSSKATSKEVNTLTFAAKSKTTPTSTKKKQEHYVMQTVKSESMKIDGAVILDDDDTIDFVLAEDEEHARETKLGGLSGELREEFHLSGEEEGEEEAGEVKEIVDHVCGKCYKTFRRVKSLMKHIEFCRYDSGYHLRKAEMLKNLEKIEKDAVVMEKKDICFCCSESYDTFHLGHINCPDCPKSFKTQMSYERHIFITHSEFNDYPCTICNAKLRSSSLLKLHEEQHKNRGKPWACKICGKDFTRSYHLKRHQKYSSCSTNENDTMSCKVCDKVFYRLDNLRAHLKQHLGTQVAKKPEYMCNVCKNCFYSWSTLNIHIRTHTGEKPFDCDLCDKKFSALVALKKHRRYHTGEKPYTCTVCNQSFAVKEVLNRHMKRHTGERPHKCEECGKSFIQATQLRTHAKTHLRPYDCDVCEEKFKTQKQLDRHVKEHTRNKRTKKLPYECGTCKLSFRSAPQLQAHMDKGEHKVPVKQRKTRKRIKTNERRDCAICDIIFDTSGELRAHILKIHKCDPDDIFGKKPKASNNTAQADGSPLAKRIKRAPAKKSTKPVAASTLISSNTDNNGVVVREFLVDEVPAAGAGSQQTIILENEAYTVIPLEELDSKTDAATAAATATSGDEDGADNDVKPQVTSPLTKKVQRKSLAASLAAAIADNEDEETLSDDENSALNEEDLKLKENVAKLLDMLVDNATLKKFGWPETSEEIVLCKVIENCGHELAKDSENYESLDYAARMREYLKLLFKLVIHNDSIKELLNNYPIDEVIEYVLGNDDDDDDDDDDDNDNDEKVIDEDDDEDVDAETKAAADNVDEKDTKLHVADQKEVVIT